jgi:hypothetical protein
VDLREQASARIGHGDWGCRQVREQMGRLSDFHVSGIFFIFMFLYFQIYIITKNCKTIPCFNIRVGIVIVSKKYSCLYFKNHRKINIKIKKTNHAGLYFAALFPVELS